MKKVESLLSECIDIDRQIRMLKIEIESLKYDLGNIRPISYNEKVHTSRSISSNVEIEIIRKEEKEEDLKKQKKMLELKKARLDNAIEVLNSNELEVIRLRYLESDLSLQMIADYMFLSKSTIHNYNKKALTKLKRILY